MKFISLLVLVTCSINIYAQTELCKGAYFTEEQGKQFLIDYAPKALSGWHNRRAKVLEQLKAGMELPHLNVKAGKAVIHSKKVMDGYTVENVYFESLPGIYVTGNLYRPLAKAKKYPVVLSPHGHGKDPRMAEYTQIRCAMLAKMGIITFAWDMIGQGDAKQCSHDLPKALKLQTINSIAALDFVLSLPGADKKKVAVSGESGGGTQSFILAALDDRIALSAPCVMVSAYFFGGCTCESGMPIHKKGEYQTTNAEIAALAAPKPMLLISNGSDWTKNNPISEYPYMQKVYQLYNNQTNVQLAHFPEEKHDYGPSKRNALYQFLAQHFKVKTFEKEQITPLSAKELSVFNEAYPMPANALQGDKAITDALNAYK